MIVSKEKSTVVASKPSVAVAIALKVNGGVVKAARHATVLGADAVGGSKRCTYQAIFRLWSFTQNVCR